MCVTLSSRPTASTVASFTDIYSRQATLRELQKEQKRTLSNTHNIRKNFLPAICSSKLCQTKFLYRIDSSLTTSDALKCKIMHSIIYHIHMRPLDLLTYSSIIYLIFKIDFWSLEICIPIAVIYKFVQAIRHFFCNGIKVRGICQTGHSGKPRRFQLSIHHGIEVEVVVPRLCFDFITSATQITKSGDGVPLKEAFDQLLHITYKYIRQL